MTSNALQERPQFAQWEEWSCSGSRCSWPRTPVKRGDTGAKPGIFLLKYEARTEMAKQQERCSEHSLVCPKMNPFPALLIPRHTRSEQIKPHFSKRTRLLPSSVHCLCCSLPRTPALAQLSPVCHSRPGPSLATPMKAFLFSFHDLFWVHMT